MSFFLHAARAAFIAGAITLDLSTANAIGLAPDERFDAPEFHRPNPAYRTFVLPDGKFLRFFNTETLAGHRTGALTRHFPDGSLDTSFRFNGELENVGAAALLPDGRLIISGIQREYELGTERVLRLNADGSVDPAFKVPDVDSMSVLQVASILPLADGKILVAGVFTNFSGTSRVGIVRLEASGNLDTTFSRVTTTTQTGVPIGIVGAALQADGKIVIVGDFPGSATTTIQRA